MDGEGLGVKGEGVGFHLRWIKEKMEKLGIKIGVMHAMGGAGTSDVWMQIISNILGSEIRVVSNSQEAGAVGAALTAAVGLGIYQDLAVADDFVEIEKTYFPKQEKKYSIYNDLYREFVGLYDLLSPLYRRIHNIDHS